MRRELSPAVLLAIAASLFVAPSIYVLSASMLNQQGSLDGAGLSRTSEAIIWAAGGIALVVPFAIRGTMDSSNRATQLLLILVVSVAASIFGFVLSFLTVLITAVSIVNERLSGTFDQLQLTPASSLEILLGKLLPLGAVFSLDMVLMVGVAGLALGVWPAGNVLFFLLVSSFYVITSLSLGLIFSATSATAAEAVQKTVLFSIPLVQLSGFAFPIRNMPLPVQWLAELFPATHYIRVTRGVYLRGEGLLELWPELFVLALFGALLVAVALRSLERRV